MEAYQAKFGEIPSCPWPIYAAEAVNILAYAIDKSGAVNDSEALAEYLRNDVNAVQGITGKVGFTEQGDREGVTKVLYVVNDQGEIVLSD